MDIKKQLEGVVETLINDIKLSVENEIKETASTEIISRLVDARLDEALERAIAKKLREMLELGNLPQKSIGHQCIDFAGFGMTGDQIKGGIIEQFGSTGIEDRASSVQLTIMDKASAFENPVFVPALKVAGTLTVEGDLLVKGEIPTDSKTFTNLVEYSTNAVKEKLDENLFAGYAELVGKNLKESGLDLDTITQNGKPVVKGNQLGYHITDTNIQRLGMVKDLQTTGETLLSGSLYVTQKRAGVNTLDPSAAFVVWDEEVELIVTKRRQDEAFIGTNRPQKFIIGSNKKENLICNTDGTVQIDNLFVGKTQLGSSASVPNFSSHHGHILFNQNPSLGGPMGWVCLGGTRWANFGIID